jgi:hypothetical protein
VSNDVKIRVTSSNDTKGTRDEVRRDFASMGLQAGNDFSKNLESSVKGKAAQVGDTAGKEFNKGLTRSTKGGAKDVGKDFASSLSDGIKGDVKTTGVKLGEEFAAAFDQGAKKAGKGFAERVYLNARAGLRPAGEELGREFSDSFDGKTTSAGKKTGEQVGRNIVKGAESQTSGKGALIALGIEAGLGPAGGVAGAAVAGAFAVGLAGMGVAAAAQTPKVLAAFQQLSTTAGEQWKAWGKDLEAPVTASLEYVRQQFIHLAPVIDDALRATGPGIKVMTTGLVDLAANAIPKLDGAAHQMGPVWYGIKSLFGDVGTSIGDLASTAGDHSASIGADFEHVGNVVQGVVSLADHLIGELADDFAQHGGELTRAVSSIDSAVTSLGAGAFPVLGNAIGADLTVIKGFFDVIGAGGAPLGMLVGGLASAATNAKLLSLAQGPVANFATTLKEAGTKGSAFGDFTTKAGTAMDKFGKSLPVVGVALTAIGLLMEQLTQHERDAVAAGQEVAKGLETGGGAAVNARAQLASWQQQVKDGKQALIDLSKSQNDYNDVLEAGATGMSANGLGQQAQQQAIDDANLSIKTAMDSYNKYAVAAGLAMMNTDEFTGVVKTYDSSAQNATSNTAQLAADMLILKDNTAGADQKVKALQDTLALMSDQGLQKADDAMDQFGSVLGTFNDGVDKMKGKVFDGSGQLNSFSDAGRTVRQVIEDGRDSMVAYAQAAADAGVPQDQINAKLGDMANQMANTIGPTVGSRSAADDLLRTYHAMPDDITTHLHADTSDAQGVINTFIRMNDGRQVSIFVNAAGDMGGIASAGRLAHGGNVGSAASGRTIGGGSPTLVGEQGMEKISYGGRSRLATGPSLLNLPVGATVTPHGNTMQQLAQAGVGGGAPTEVHLTIDAADDPASQAMLYLLRKSIRTQGGNVQAVLGRS